MPKTLQLTTRDKQLLGALCQHVRLFSLSQIASAWWASSIDAKHAARKRLKALTDAGFLVRTHYLVDDLPDMAEPVLCWELGQAEPDLGATAWKLQSRWARASKTETVYLGTQLAAKLFGGRAKGALPQPYQATHDLGVAEMYLRFRQSRPEQLQYWIGEDLLAPHRRGQKLPDAVIASAPGTTPSLVLEFGGSYDKARLHEFHQDCFLRSLPYEVW